MRVLYIALAAAALACVAAQDAYTQGVVSGAALALAGTAVVGLGAIALQNNGRRNRGYAPYHRYGPPPQPYYGGGGGGYYQYQQPYYRGGRRFRRDAVSDAESVELSFEKVLSRDKQQCGMRLVCELEARAAAGEDLGDYGQLIVDGLFGSSPAPVPASALQTATGKYGYAAYVGSQTDLKTCAELYSTCKYSSKVILSLVRLARAQRTL